MSALELHSLNLHLPNLHLLATWVAAYLLNSLWQVPVIFIAAWFAARIVRNLGPRTEHRVWVSALIAQAVLPACNFRVGSLWQTAWQLVKSTFAGAVGRGSVQVLVGPGTAPAGGALRLPPALLEVAAILYGCSLLYLTGRLLWGLATTRALSRNAEYLDPSSELGQRVSLRSRFFRIDLAQVAISQAAPGPITVGIRRRVLLLPAGFLDSVNDEQLDAVLSHESAHIERRDFAKNILYRVLSLPVAWHPATWRTFARLAESREMVCDAMAAESAIGRESYARSLLRLASTLSQRRPAVPLHAIGIFDAHSFERRLMRLTGKQKNIRGVRRVAIVLAGAALGIGACGSVMALNLHVDAASAINAVGDSKPPVPKKIMVSAGVMAGNKLGGPTPKYPEEAKKAKIQGTVVLKTTIGKDGTVEDLHVISGPKELQQSSLDAVKQWTYKPYLLNGEPVEVETQINVIYTLAK